MITVEERADELYEVVRSCTLCPLSRSRTHAVPGEGPLDAEVMCIGEAPGVNEDKQGRPFVGAAGQFLSELLAAAGLTREQVYICNVLKCRPPGNRDPLPGEIDACSEYLDLQLDLVDPLVVVTLGRFSMSKWFPQQAISRIHGSVKDVDGRFIIPMYHPAAALHQGNLRQVLLDDFAQLPAILDRARQDRARSASQREEGTAAPASPSAANAASRERGPETPPPERNASIARMTSSETEPPWVEADLGEYEVEFDPGDHSPARSASVPAFLSPATPRSRERGSADAGPPPVGGASLESRPSDAEKPNPDPPSDLPSPPPEEPSAATSQQQLSLFE